VWLGTVLPRRHARRAVTRNLLRRAIREAAFQHADRLGAGMWLVRLRAPFERAGFPSADSPPLRRALRRELAELFGRALAR